MNPILIDIQLFQNYFEDTKQNNTKLKILLEKIHSAKDYQAYIASADLIQLKAIMQGAIKQGNNAFDDAQIQAETKKTWDEVMRLVKIAKTPSYIVSDMDNLEKEITSAVLYALDARLLSDSQTGSEQNTIKTITMDALLAEIESDQITSIDFAHLKKQYFQLQADIEREMDDVLNTTSFILGPKVNQLESKLAAFTKCEHVVSCSNGTDALLLALMALDIGADDEVITTPFSFIATAETIAYLKATPIFVDIDADTFNIDVEKIEEKITNKTKAIMPVSLFGQAANLDKINQIAKKHNLKVIIDGAQSFGATYQDKNESHFCDIYTTSFFPAKPLGCYGDGGAVLTNQKEIAEKITMLRHHGQNKRYHHQYIGMGGRLDTLQAGVLLAKLPSYHNEIIQRQNVAKSYTIALGKRFKTPIVASDNTSVWAQYTLRIEENRDALAAYLKEKKIPTAVHYPMPLHRQACFQYLNQQNGSYPVAEKIAKQVLSLPMNPFLVTEEIEYICDALIQYYS